MTLSALKNILFWTFRDRLQKDFLPEENEKSVFKNFDLFLTFAIWA
jgi:hypothetical protein